MPTGSPRPVRARCTSWTLSSRASGHIPLRCFTAFSMTFIERPGGTLYLFSAAQWPPGISAPLLISGYGTMQCEQNHSRGPLASPAIWSHVAKHVPDGSYIGLPPSKETATMHEAKRASHLFGKSPGVAANAPSMVAGGSRGLGYIGGKSGISP